MQAFIALHLMTYQISAVDQMKISVTKPVLKEDGLHSITSSFQI